MTLSAMFVLLVVLVEAAITAAYAWQGQWKLAGVWLGVAFANFCMFLLDKAK